MPESETIGREARRVADQVAHWTPARWRLPTDAGRSRGDATYAVVNTLAQLSAAAEHRPPREVPRLPYDTALPDQLRVVADDLAAAEPPEPIRREAAEAIARLRELLF